MRKGSERGGAGGVGVHSGKVILNSGGVEWEGLRELVATHK